MLQVRSTENVPRLPLSGMAVCAVFTPVAASDCLVSTHVFAGISTEVRIMVPHHIPPLAIPIRVIISGPPSRRLAARRVRISIKYIPGCGSPSCYVRSPNGIQRCIENWGTGRRVSAPGCRGRFCSNTTAAAHTPNDVLKVMKRQLGRKHTFRSLRWAKVARIPDNLLIPSGTTLSTLARLT